MLSRLGLRGAEVADLQVGDVHWGNGEITIRGKGYRLERRPLPSDVGEAMIGVADRTSADNAHANLTKMSC